VQSVEFGWHVDPNVEPDANTHLFSYSTQNGYNPNFNGYGCYNLGCSQFTQVSSPMYFPGQTVSGIVYPGQGQPVEYAFEAFNPGASYPAQYHNWYIYVNGSLIGYYAGSLFAGTMQTAAATWEVGGEVFSDYVNSPNDDVQMGSGYSPNGNGFPWPAYDRNIYYINSGSGSATYCGNPFCSNGFCFVDPRPSWGLGVCGYQATTFYAQSTTNAPGGSQSSCWGPYFYYGGGI
jgi:hypothetical protein